MATAVVAPEVLGLISTIFCNEAPRPDHGENTPAAGAGYAIFILYFK
jgi:hypothetical protein